MKQLSDEEARQRFELLFKRHRRSVLGYALRRVDDPADAADVLAATFLVSWRRIEDVPEGEDARPWLLAVARRALANERRGARRRDALAARIGRELTVRMPAVAPERSRDEAASVWRALSRLSEEDREVLLLAGWEELPPAQIAVVLGVRSVTARSRLHRARRRLRTELEVDGGEDDARGTRPTRPILDLATEETR